MRNHRAGFLVRSPHCCRLVAFEAGAVGMEVGRPIAAGCESETEAGGGSGAGRRLAAAGRGGAASRFERRRRLVPRTLPVGAARAVLRAIPWFQREVSHLGRAQWTVLQAKWSSQRDTVTLQVL
ncbi:hypothetical protein HMPREF1317_1491 [Schaalia georgiae F0490]|uniref:Uncharacterized protein n=1 Tax=Schaalia georgiae F0490 TaxID=1125717 RepID=J1H5U1_9ACTO|nr:hypothetical protein HMPREF1317_1491 [Schaalia georgiae F0490]